MEPFKGNKYKKHNNTKKTKIWKKANTFWQHCIYITLILFILAYLTKTNCKTRLNSFLLGIYSCICFTANAGHICCYLLILLNIRNLCKGDVYHVHHDVPNGVTYCTGRHSEGFRNAPNWHQEIYGPNEFNKLSQGPIWHSGSVLWSTPAMAPLQHVSI